MSNKLAFHLIQPGEQIPVIHNDNGFRISQTVENGPARRNKCILFLGCSFTHGYGVPAEKTFASITSDKVDATPINAGGCGWGLSQMLLRARDVIPQLKPDLVVAQFSNWLPVRSTQLYAPAKWALAPVPYFYECDGRTEIQSPVFSMFTFNHSDSARAKGSLLQFTCQVGIPLCLHDDAYAARTLLQKATSVLPSPTTSERAVHHAYEQIEQLSKANGAQLLILVLPRKVDDKPAYSLDFVDVPVVRTLDYLKLQLPEPTQQAWSEQYRIWRGDPPRMVNRHPNVRMHAEIAKVLTEAISELSVP